MSIKQGKQYWLAAISESDFIWKETYGMTLKTIEKDIENGSGQ
jgi:hypothetical protein